MRDVIDQDELPSLMSEDVAEASRDPEGMIVGDLLSDDVKRALERCPTTIAWRWCLCDLEEFSYKEIADIMDCPVGTVMSRLHRGRRLLQKALRDYAVREGIVKEADVIQFPSRRRTSERRRNHEQAGRLRCAGISRFVDTYLDGEFAEHDRAEFEAHLAECDACSAKVHVRPSGRWRSRRPRRASRRRRRCATGSRDRSLARRSRCSRGGAGRARDAGGGGGGTVRDVDDLEGAVVSGRRPT